eukprot:3818048-Amphidinium_carterae.2
MRVFLADSETAHLSSSRTHSSKSFFAQLLLDARVRQKGCSTAPTLSVWELLVPIVIVFLWHLVLVPDYLKRHTVHHLLGVRRGQTGNYTWKLHGRFCLARAAHNRSSVVEG